MDWLRFRRPESEVEDDALVPDSDAHPADGNPRRLASDPEVRRRMKLRRRAFVLVLSAVFVAGGLAALFAESGYLDRRRLQSEVHRLGAEIQARRTVVEALEDEVKRLETEPMAKERIAREQLGLVRPGEVDFLLPKQDRSGSPRARSGSRP